MPGFPFEMHILVYMLAKKCYLAQKVNPHFFLGISILIKWISILLVRNDRYEDIKGGVKT